VCDLFVSERPTVEFRAVSGRLLVGPRTTGAGRIYGHRATSELIHDMCRRHLPPRHGPMPSRF